MNNLIFWIRWQLMPRELKKGTWLIMGDEAINLSEYWRRSTKKKTWFLPRIEWRDNIND